MTIGSAYFVYISEVLCGSAMGMAVFIQMCSLLTITFLSPLVIETFEIDTIFYTLTIGEVFPFVLLGYFMKETKGLSHQEKYRLYRRDNVSEINSEDGKKQDEGEPKNSVET
jgi:hypothetical protein